MFPLVLRHVAVSQWIIPALASLSLQHNGELLTMATQICIIPILSLSMSEQKTRDCCLHVHTAEEGWAGSVVCHLELDTKFLGVFTIMEKAPTKAPMTMRAFTLKNLPRHYMGVNPNPR